MDTLRELEQMIEGLRHQRESCEEKSNQDPRYFHYSSAVSALLGLVDDIRREDQPS